MSRRQRRRSSHRRKHESYRRSSSHFRQRRGNGWGMNLYRNTRESMIAGVASGLADHWDIAPWVVRLMWVGAFLFTGTLAFWGYIACWFLMARRPTQIDLNGKPSDELDYEPAEVEMEYDERHHDYRPRKVFRYADSSSVRLKRARDRLDAALRRVEDVEPLQPERRRDRKSVV